MSGIYQEKCCHPYCRELQVANGGHSVYGEPQYRKWCQEHYDERKAKKAGFNTIAEYTADRLEQRAKKAGFASVTEYKNSKHPYRQHRKSYCENRDGRLGYVCDCEIRHPAQLQVDHIDGNPSNNDQSNLQTLCANCHIYKTHAEKDYATPGRKSLKEAGYDVYD